MMLPRSIWSRGGATNRSTITSCGTECKVFVVENASNSESQHGGRTIVCIHTRGKRKCEILTYIVRSELRRRRGAGTRARPFHPFSHTQ